MPLEIDNAKAKKNRAIDILNRKNVPKSLQWLMDEYIQSFIQIGIEEISGQYDNQEINKSRIFTSGENSYELYYLAERSVSVPDGAINLGMFNLVFNGDLVLKTNYFKDYPEDGG